MQKTKSYDAETMPLTESYQEELIECLKDPVEASAYLEAALEEREPELLKLAIANVAESRGAMVERSLQSDREKLDRMLPEIYSFMELLEVLGFQLAVAIKED
jgi:DNA-binding phage protein